jgi:primosomal protein N'
MKILEIIPFNKNFKSGALSYFSSNDVPVGSIVTINVRNRDLKGLVIKSSESEDQKSEIKNSEFTLKKIKSSQKNTIINQAIIDASEEVANFFATSTGAVINSVIPKFVLDNIDKIKKITNEINPEIKEKQKTSEKYVLQEPDSERYGNYRRLIREEFAKKKSVLFVCPTIEDTKYAYEKLSKGIEDNTFIFHSGYSTAELIKNWNDAVTNKKNVLIISTGTYASIPRNDLGSIVVERESSRLYRSMQSPYLDFRLFAEEYAKKRNIRFFLGDLVLRLETLLRLEDQEFYEFTSVKYRNLTTAQMKLINMSDYKSSNGEEFTVLSDDLKDMIKTSVEENENVFLFTSRRGLSPSIVCMDCGKIVSCNNCNSPMVLHGKEPTEKHNFFLCHRCNEKRSAGELCIKCNSWRLKTLGIGTELIKKEIEKISSNLKVFILDSDNIKNQSQAVKLVEKFNSNPGSILIGTEMALLYLRDDIDNVGIVSIDSMFSNPDFNINEKILNSVLRSKSKATKKFLIQTRKAEENIFKYILSGNLAEFIRLELDDRKKYNYPPYSILIKIIIKGTPKGVEREIEKLREFLQEFEIVEYPIIRESTKTKIATGILIRFDRQSWPSTKLVEKLRLLPAYYKIVVNAENIF